jgi:hypothetical protein
VFELSNTYPEGAALMSNAEHPHDKTFDITINGRARSVTQDALTFEQAIALAFPEPPTGPQVMFTVAYRRAEGNKSGSLAAGTSVKLKEGMIFDVTATDKS